MLVRKNKLNILLLLDGPASEAIKEGIIRKLTPHKKHVLTLTSDNGKDFPSHPEIIENLGSAFLFLHALSLLGARFKREYHRVGTAVLYQRYVFF